MQSGWFSKRPSHFWVKEARHKLSQMFLFILISERGKTNPCCEDSGQGFHLGEEILTQIWVCSLWKNSSNVRFSLSASPFVSGDALFHFNLAWIWEWPWGPFYSLNHYFLKILLYQALGAPWWAKQTWSFSHTANLMGRETYYPQDEHSYRLGITFTSYRSWK